ncbi:hypothetical protein [Paenibacillus terrigena]|uniref:hypothetical protein n=1 Tax=Paenibacillus terrigena TaxID=369333 RepID=UPI0028D203F1|nr:hypothetical protein [Paenibacillus terrigena]
MIRLNSARMRKDIAWRIRRRASLLISRDVFVYFGRGWVGANLWLLYNAIAHWSGYDERNGIFDMTKNVSAYR